ncbi:MAG: hypothetical protein M1819_006872 [Sarea resinae]|nr:MAG: hypothetical protein M1819_006872 [Sarea resinae]
MPLSITVPDEYGYVLLAATSTALIGQWHSFFTGRYRKPAKVPYPNAYAPEAVAKTSPEAYAFNCAQRAHANFLENLPVMLPSLLIAGLRWPVAASVLGGIWGAGRIVYALGYVRSSLGADGRGRLKGFWFMLAQFGLLGMAGSVGWSVLNGGW